MERKIEMSFFFEYEFDTKVDGMNGRFTGQEIVNLSDYEEVDKMIQTVQKVMLKKRNGEITFRCVKFSPEYNSQCMIRLVSQYRKAVIRWNEGQDYGNDEEYDSWNAKMLKAFCIEAMNEYKSREAEAEYNMQYAVAI